MRYFLTSNLRSMYAEFLEWSGSLVGKRVAWIQNGNDVYEDPYRMNETKQFFPDQGCEIVPVDLRVIQGRELKEVLTGIDGIYVTGGNIFYLLDLVRRSGFDSVLEELRSTDIWYAGSSAGAALLGKSIAHCSILDDPSKGPNLESTDALGRVDACILPHWGNKKFDEKFQKIFELTNLPAPLLLMEDHQYITSMV